jgi:glycosyltransferase involved in cell wall biosynthesis
MVEAFIVGWNESETIRLTLSHYNSFCEKVTLFDNYSTDGTPDIAREMGAEVKQFGTPGVLSDDDYLTVKNNCWKKSKANWVVVCDSDEILWPGHAYTRLLLDKYREFGVTIPKTVGFDVVSHEMPQASFLELRNGFQNGNYSKSIVFNPQAIKEINYRYGSHVCKPVGDVVYSPHEEFMVMHYRNIGGPMRLVDRHALYRPRMSEKNKRFGLGCHYEYSDEQRIREWYEKYDGCSEWRKDGFLYSPVETRH